MSDFLLFVFAVLFAFLTPSSSHESIATLLAGNNHHHHFHRRFLHQPLFPLDQTVSPALPPVPEAHPPISEANPPFLSPKSQPKYPFSTQSPPSSPFIQNPFFPFYGATPPPPPPSPVSSSIATFPANISSLILPHSSASSGKPISHKLIAVIVSVSVVFAVVVVAIAAFLLHRHSYGLHQQHPYSKTDSLRLFPPDTVPSDSSPPATDVKKQPPGPPLPRYAPSSTSSEFLYLGTLVSSREVDCEAIDAGPTQTKKNPSEADPSASSVTEDYQGLGSPELRPLPPLPRHHFQQTYKNANAGSDEEEEFFSPRGSAVGDKDSPESPEMPRSSSGKAFQNENLRSQSSNSYHYSVTRSGNQSLSSSPSVMLNLSPRSSILTRSPDSIVNFPGPPPCIPPPPPRERRALPASPPSSGNTQNSPSRASDFSSQNLESPMETLRLSGQFFGVRRPPPPPPPLPPRFWETPDIGAGPPVLAAPSRPVLGQNQANVSTNTEASAVRNESPVKPKLKPLHWDKVRASSDRAMVWDQLKSSSFQLNEEMIETLFMVNSSNSNSTNGVKRSIMPVLNQENQVLDPKKSQNIAILLRALNVTIDEVCDALLEGNADMLGSELLESLLKMAPTKEEEQKLKEFTDESPFKLGPAERFLKAVLHVPHAFKRVEAMLYIANFDSEVDYLKRSFETLEEACKELRNSRMFLRLLEAVLKTGNRMNDGTNRGHAQAFKLDTLLKLVDVKGTDGRTTLLHFVVQEIIRAEGSRLSGADQNSNDETNHLFGLQNEVEFRKVGLQVVSGLSGELSNVKKAAAMDSDAISGDVQKLTSGVSKVTEILKLNQELTLVEAGGKFSESMKEFLKKADQEIIKIQTQEGLALSMVKELTEYFHGNSTKEEAHPFRIFMVVRDFLSILDQVCKDVGKMNDRTIMSSGRQFPVTVNPTTQIFSGINGKQQNISSDDESSASP